MMQIDKFHRYRIQMFPPLPKYEINSRLHRRSFSNTYFQNNLKFYARQTTAMVESCVQYVRRRRRQDAAAKIQRARDGSKI